MFEKLIIPILIICFMTSCAIVGYFREKKNWNNGHCKCGDSWEQFNTDSQGSRGYKCLSCSSKIWISYKID